MQNSMIKKKLRSFIIFISDFRARLATIFYDNAYNNATKYIKVFCATLKYKKNCAPGVKRKFFHRIKGSCDRQQYLMALKQSRIVATVVACAQLCEMTSLMMLMGRTQIAS